MSIERRDKLERRQADRRQLDRRSVGGWRLNPEGRRSNCHGNSVGNSKGSDRRGETRRLQA